MLHREQPATTKCTNLYEKKDARAHTQKKNK